MEEGFALETGHGYRSPTFWVAGAPEGGSLLGTDISDKEKFPIRAFRCRTCGWLELYAQSS
jgi:hypothetical protein